MEDNKNVKLCKGCHKELPEDYKGKYCLACKGKKAEKAKQAFGVVASAGALGAITIKKVKPVLVTAKPILKTVSKTIFKI